MKLVDISERVTATYYDDENEEWSAKTVTIEEILDAVCDDYTVIEPQEEELETLLCSLPQAQDAAGQDYVQLIDVLETVRLYKAKLPSAQTDPEEWNNHTVACLLAELFGDTCACNYNGIDEWLPEKCEVIDTCPKPVGVACWEQFLKHRAEKRTDES